MFNLFEDIDGNVENLVRLRYVGCEISSHSSVMYMITTLNTIIEQYRRTIILFIIVYEKQRQL
jgi:hypothetical protein